MAITTYAAIDVGSSELCMKIYELSRQGGIRELTYVRHRLSLGTETYTKGFISYQTTNEICNTLNDITNLLQLQEVFLIFFRNFPKCHISVLKSRILRKYFLCVIFHEVFGNLLMR